MACIKKRKNHGHVRYVVDFRDQHGTRHMRFYATRKEADDALTELKVEVKRGTYLDPAELPDFATVARNWLATQRDRAPQTFRFYRAQIEHYLIPGFGARRVDQITTQHVQTWKMELWNRDTRQKGKLSRTTVNQTLQRLRAVLDYAVVAGHLRANPADKMRVKGLRKQRQADRASAEAIDKSKVLTMEQGGAVLDAAADGLDRMFIELAFFTGCRVGELQALRWSDLDLESGALEVHRSLSREPGEAGANGRARYGSSTPIFGPPKSDASFRTIELAGDLVRDLKAWFLQSRFKADDALVFANSLGAPLHRAALSKGLRIACERAGTPVIGLHGCRHSFASWLLLQGKPVTQVARLLGHGDPDITLKRYSHWYKGESNRDAVEGLAAALTEARGKRMVSDGAERA